MAPITGVCVLQASFNLWVSPDHIMELLTALALQYLGIEFDKCPNALKKVTPAALITAAFGSSQDLPWFGLDQFRQYCLHIYNNDSVRTKYTITADPSTKGQRTEQNRLISITIDYTITVGQNTQYMNEYCSDSCVFNTAVSFSQR